MQLEDYFDFISEPVEVIRIKGTRLDIEFVIRRHLEGMTPEQITARYGGGLTLERTYAAITYYLQNRESLDDYLRRCHEAGEANYRAYLEAGESPLLKKLRSLKQAQQVAS